MWMEQKRRHLGQLPSRHGSLQGWTVTWNVVTTAKGIHSLPPSCLWSRCGFLGRKGIFRGKKTHPARIRLDVWGDGALCQSSEDPRGLWLPSHCRCP